MLRATQEQFDDTTPHRMIGTPVGVWQVAKCIYELIMFGRPFNTANYFYCRFPSLNLTIETFGRKILRPKYGNEYTDCLRSLLLHCLARDPTQRPTPQQLLRQCQKALKTLEPENRRFTVPEGNEDDEQKKPAFYGPGWYSSWSHKVSTKTAADSMASSY
jgi:serine/threonine protein kinase